MTSDLAKGHEGDDTKQLKFKVKALEGELDEKDKEYERRLRTMRQELERMRPIYEAKSKDPELAKRVN
jgi:hypothetical protein